MLAIRCGIWTSSEDNACCIVRNFGGPRFESFRHTPPPPPFHWTAIPLRSWRSRIFSKIIPNRRGPGRTVSEGQKVLGPSMISRRQTATMWAQWPLILINPMSMEGGYSFFNYMRLEPLRIGPRIQKSDTNLWRALEQGLELARTPRA